TIQLPNQFPPCLQSRTRTRQFSSLENARLGSGKTGVTASCSSQQREFSEQRISPNFSLASRAGSKHGASTNNLIKTGQPLTENSWQKPKLGNLPRKLD